jgi:PiT family inorganic phosphate transporter
MGAAAVGMPTSTTHVITSTILGVGLSKRISAVNWKVAYRILGAWLMTIPASAFVSYLTYQALTPVLGQ